MSHSSRRNFLMGLMVPLAITACAKSSPSEQAAHSFMTAYYVNMDMKTAEQYTADLAKEKLNKQISLLDGQTVGAGTQVPTVDVSLFKKDSESPDEATYIYEVTPKAKDVGHRKVYVKVRQEAGQWKVTQFQESDQGPT